MKYNMKNEGARGLYETPECTCCTFLTEGSLLSGSPFNTKTEKLTIEEEDDYWN